MNLHAKPLAVLAASIALLLGAAACGDDADTTPSQTSTSGSGQTADERSGDSRESDGSPAGSGPPSESGAKGGDGGSKEDSGSGGGTAQFRVKGGDNSIQEFGSEAAGSELEAAAAALHGFLDARVKGDWEATCEHVSEQVVESLTQLASQSEQLKGQGCPELLKALMGSVPRSARAEAAEADVGAMRVEGEAGYLLYHGADGVDYAMPMSNEDGEWKVGALAGTPIS